MAFDASDFKEEGFDTSDFQADEVQPQSSWLGAAKGVGEVGLSMGASGLKSVTHAINDLLPEAIVGGPGSRAAIEQKINKDSTLNYQPQTEEGKYLMGKIRELTSPISSVGSTVHDYLERGFGKRTADVVGDVATLTPFALRDLKDIKGMISDKSAAIESGHPLSGVAEEESSRLTQMKADAESRGYELPEGGTQDVHARAAQNNTPLVNADMRSELNLPKNAPLTPKVLEQARQKFGSPGYQAVQKLSDEIPLNRGALDEARINNMNAAPNERLPFPQGDTITGAQAVDFSKKARYLANNMEKNPANPFAAQDAQMYRDAAEAVEDSVANHLESTGRGQIAKDWDAARVYYAKSHSVESALDGAGNVRAGDLRTQLFKRGKPLSGNLETIANLAAQYPEAFKTSRVSMPYAGPVRRVVASGLPLAGAAVGGTLAGGFGAAAGEAAGAYGGNKLLGK